MAEFVKESRMDYYREVLEELREFDFGAGYGLDKWEMDFIDTLLAWDGLFTTSQADVLEKIHDRYFRKREIQ